METYTYKLVEDEHGNIQCGDKLYRFEETIKEDNKPSYEELEKENKKLKKQLEYLRNGEYLNQVKWERDFNEKIPEEIIVGKKQPTHRIKKIEKKINEIINYLDYLKSKGE